MWHSKNRHFAQGQVSSCRVKEVKGVGKRSYVKHRLIVARGPRYHSLMTTGRFSRNGLRYTPTGNTNELIIDIKCQQARRRTDKTLHMS